MTGLNIWTLSVIVILPVEMKRRQVQMRTLMVDGPTLENAVLHVGEVHKREHVQIHHHPEMELTAKETPVKRVEKMIAQVGVLPREWISICNLYLFLAGNMSHLIEKKLLQKSMCFNFDNDLVMVLKNEFENCLRIALGLS